MFSFFVKAYSYKCVTVSIKVTAVLEYINSAYKGYYSVINTDCSKRGVVIMVSD